jgi:hypothetical protein
MVYVIVDIQGFKYRKNDFILKEIAVLCSKYQYHHFIIKPPIDFQSLSNDERKQIIWTTNHIHGLYWQDGFYAFNDIKNFLKNHLKDKLIYVKGYEKKIFLENFLNNNRILNVEEIDCPNLKTLKSNCKEYNHCSKAIQNVYLVKKFLLNKENEDNHQQFVNEHNFFND